MSASSALQKAIYEALVADAAVGALVGGRIYDGVPSTATFPYVSFGPDQSLEDDAECISGEDIYLQIDCWSRDQGRKRPCKEIRDAVKAALHDADLSLDDPYALSFIRVPRAEVKIAADNITAHGVLTVQAAVEW